MINVKEANHYNHNVAATSNRGLRTRYNKPWARSELSGTQTRSYGEYGQGKYEEDEDGEGKAGEYKDRESKDIEDEDNKDEDRDDDDDDSAIYMDEFADTTLDTDVATENLGAEKKTACDKPKRRDRQIHQTRDQLNKIDLACIIRLAAVVVANANLTTKRLPPNKEGTRIALNEKVAYITTSRSILEQYPAHEARNRKRAEDQQG
ncbi:hypothetical protein CaCOL14_013185 [Colletotrichum acutatum]